MATFFQLSFTLPHLHILKSTNHPNKCHFFTAKFQSFVLAKSANPAVVYGFTARASVSGEGTSEPKKPVRRGRKKKSTTSGGESEEDNPVEKIRSTKFPKEKILLSETAKQEKESLKSSSRRGRRKKEISEDESSDSDGSKPSRRGRKKKKATAPETSSMKVPKETFPEEEEEESSGSNDDEIDFPYEQPPLVCCFGAAQREFVPTVRISPAQGHPDKYSTWKSLQWNPPEFSRAPGGPPSNVAIAHVRLGGRAAFMGKVGDDKHGNDLVYKLNTEGVQTRCVKIDSSVKTATSQMKVRFQNGKMIAETSRNCAEDSFLKSDVDIAVLKEARMFHFNSEVFSDPSSAIQLALFRAIKLSKKHGGKVFFDPNFPLPLWESRSKTWDLIGDAWRQSDIIEVSKQELEFLIDEEYYEKKRNYVPQYYADSYEQTKNRRNYYHYSKEEISPLWHDGLKILFVTDGTLRIHYYTPEFDGVVVGTEDVLITPFTCDRTGSGDAVVAGIMRKLTIYPEMYSDKDSLEKHVRFAVAAGIISQWTIGATRGFPTESATQNLKEQVYVPSMW